MPLAPPSAVRALLLPAVLAAASASRSGDGAAEGGSESAAAPAARPNFVFIFADDMRKDDMVALPRIKEQMVARGTSMEYVHPRCPPSPAPPGPDSRSGCAAGTFS